MTEAIQFLVAALSLLGVIICALSWLAIREIRKGRKENGVLDLEEVRQEFSRFLAEDPRAKLRIDAALGHIALMCYKRGAADALENLEKKEEEGK